MLNLISNRRTIRKFNKKTILKPELSKIIHAGQMAPTANNKQDFQLSVISSDELISELHEGLKKALNNNNYNKFFDAKTLILISFPQENQNRKYDCGCIMENMMLASSFLNIGSVWINQFNSEEANKILKPIFKKLSIPDNHLLTAGLALGYSDENIHFSRTIKSNVKYF